MGDRRSESALLRKKTSSECQVPLPFINLHRNHFLFSASCPNKRRMHWSRRARLTNVELDLRFMIHFSWEDLRFFRAVRVDLTRSRPLNSSTSAQSVVHACVIWPSNISHTLNMLWLLIVVFSHHYRLACSSFTCRCNRQYSILLMNHLSLQSSIIQFVLLPVLILSLEIAQFGPTP